MKILILYGPNMNLFGLWSSKNNKTDKSKDNKTTTKTKTDKTYNVIDPKTGRITDAITYLFLLWAMIDGEKDLKKIRNGVNMVESML